MRFGCVPVTKNVQFSREDYKKLRKYGWWVSPEVRSAELGSDRHNPEGIHRCVVLPLAGFTGPKYYVSEIEDGYIVQGRTLLVAGYPEEIKRELLGIREKLGKSPERARFFRR